MKKMIAITIVALTLIATVLAACAEKGPVGPGHIMALASTSADESYPVWSPDGSKIFFKSDEWICVCDPDGSNREKLTKFEERFVFSPDMKRVFYMKTISDGDKVICQAYVMDIDGKNQQKIAELTLEEKYVDDTGYLGHTVGPMYGIQKRLSWAWSPDRTKIFLTKLEETGYTWVWREDEGKWVRYKAGTEPSIPILQEKGWEEVKLMAKEHENTAWIWDLIENELRFVGHLSYGIVHYLPTGEVVWSPDGTYVALPCNEFSEAGATEQIYVINVETGESRRLTSFVGANTWPVWSPDSKRIMYVQVPPKYWWSPYISDSNEGSDIWVVDIDGSNGKQLTDIPKNWEVGDWNPDGSKIAYLSWQSGSEENEIRLMNEDGSDIKLLAKAERVTGHRWSPGGSKLAFVTGKAIPVGLDRDIYVIDVPDS